jgi:hypothetical protein
MDIISVLKPERDSLVNDTDDLETIEQTLTALGRRAIV